ncbi:MAG: chromosome condensation regulator RCC1 [Polyangia bacterium]
MVVRLGPAVALLAALPAFGCGGAGGGDPDGGSSDADAGPDIAALVSAGFKHTCALTSEGDIKCWGGNWNGCLGIGYDYIEGTIPLDVLGFESGAVDVSAGYSHTCAVDAGGGVWCWGDNWHGQLGAPVGIESWEPVPVVGLDHGYVAVSAGSSHTCALSEEGEAKCWGKNDWGALGDGTTQGSLEPVSVSGLSSPAISIECAGGGATCALTQQGGVECWGNAQLCGIGEHDPTVQFPPTTAEGLGTGVSLLAGSVSHLCVALEAGGGRCWGQNGKGELGNGTSEFGWIPTKIIDLDTSLDDISSGGDHTCASTSVGKVLCWGSNHYGQLGLGSVGGEEYEPVEVAGLDGVEITSVASGGHHTCALTSTGGIKCWGDYAGGQLGNGMGFGEECVEWDDCLMPTPVDVVGFGQ